MKPAVYMNIFRTHVWDRHVAEMAEIARRSTRSGVFVIAADETKEILPIRDFYKYSHNSDFSGFHLPSVPNGRVLWWNADYPLYTIWKQYPCFDYYIMIEYDTFVNCDLDAVISKCVDRNLDLVVHQLQQISRDSHWSYLSVSELGDPLWQALIPFLIFSNRAVEMMFETRQALARQYQIGGIRHWPYCEAFLPSVAIKRGLNVGSVSDLVDSSLLRFRPFLNIRDVRLGAVERVAHPVLGGRRFVAALVAGEPKGAHLLSDGFLRPELEGEDPADIEAVLGAEAKPYAAGSQSISNDSDVIDLARDKPATQSSLSQWSRSPTIARDACRANSGSIPEDYAFHTGCELEPWWSVDLLRPSRVEAIEIVNRPNFEYRFRHFRIETSIDGLDWVVQFTKMDDRGVSSAPERPAVFRFAHPARVRHLRIVALDSEVLHLRRVRVLGAEIDAPTCAVNETPRAAAPLSPAAEAVSGSFQSPFQKAEA